MRSYLRVTSRPYVISYCLPIFAKLSKCFNKSLMFVDFPPSTWSRALLVFLTWIALISKFSWTTIFLRTILLFHREVLWQILGFIRVVLVRILVLWLILVLLWHLQVFYLIAGELVFLLNINLIILLFLSKGRDVVDL